MNEYKFDKDKIILFKCDSMVDIENNIKNIFKINEKLLPKNKEAKILIKPNFNNDLNSLTGNSTDLRIIISVLKSLKKRRYKNIILADGPNCGINHIGIDVFSRLCINQIGKMFKIKIKNLNNDLGKNVRLKTGIAEIAESALNSDFTINLPKLKTHVEAGISISCKNYIGCFKGTEKRKIHDNLNENIIRINEIVKTDLIIVDGLVGMEGRGPGDGTPKKAGIILTGHNVFLMDLLCAKLMGQDYKKIGFLKSAIDKLYITQDDIKIVEKIKENFNFKPAKKRIIDRILLNNFFINLRFSKFFEGFFNRGFVPWILFKLKVKQDKYILEEKDIKRLSEKKNLNEEKRKKLKKCLETYCPLRLDKLNNKNCLKCMYCYQILPSLIDVEGNLGDFKMQLERFGRFTREDD